MSLYTDLYEKLYTTENMLLAEKLAIKNKSNNIYVKIYLKNRGVLLRLLQKSLKNKTYKTSEYTTTIKASQSNSKTMYKLT